MLSLPASKGFDVGSGFGCVDYTGLEHNDVVAKHDTFRMFLETSGLGKLGAD